MSKIATGISQDGAHKTKKAPWTVTARNQAFDIQRKAMQAALKDGEIAHIRLMSSHPVATPSAFVFVTLEGETQPCEKRANALAEALCATIRPDRFDVPVTGKTSVAFSSVAFNGQDLSAHERLHALASLKEDAIAGGCSENSANHALQLLSEV